MYKEKEQMHASLWYTRDCRQLREKRSQASVEDEGKSKFIFQEPCSNVSMYLFLRHKERVNKRN